MTPLLLAASTGLADVVQMLCKRGANPRIKDNKGRGILQLAEKCQKGRSALRNWLMNEYWHLPMTNAEGRSAEKRQRSVLSQEYRRRCNPYKKRKDWNQRKDWEPDWEGWRQRKKRKW